MYPAAVDCADYYHEVQKLHIKILDATCAFADFRLHAEAHAFVEDLLAWEKVVSGLPETTILKKAIFEYQTALVLVTIGHYRQAFIALRSFIELLLLYIDHSTHLLHHLQWLRVGRDLNWASLVDADNGVLSKAFCTCFFEELSTDIAHVNGIAKILYRECSEYAHGNATKDALLPSFLEASEAAFQRWQAAATSARYVAQFALSMRHLQQLPATDRGSVEAAVLDTLGHFEVIRALFSTPKA